MNEHKDEEIQQIKEVYQKYKNDGLAEVYVQLSRRGYKRCYDSMCRQIRKIIKGQEINKKKKRKYKQKHEEVRGEYPGDKVQIDIKHVPMEYLRENKNNQKYYQITAIDEFTRKRVLEIEEEKSVTNTTKFLDALEEKMGFKINAVQTDNGSEFVNNSENSKKTTAFEDKLDKLGIKHKRTRPYSPWQNGKVERSNRIDGERFYSKRYKNITTLKSSNKRYCSRYNNSAKRVLSFKSPNEIVKDFKMIV